MKGALLCFLANFLSPADRRLGRRSRPDPKALPAGYGIAFREKVDCSNVQLTGKRTFEMFIIERTTGKLKNASRRMHPIVVAIVNDGPLRSKNLEMPELNLRRKI